MRTTEVTEKELDEAKQAVLNSFVFNFDSPAKTLNRVMRYEYFGYPKDFLFQYQKAIAAVTRADVLRVAKEHIRPEELAIVAVGNPKEFGKPLTTLGKVSELDLTIPEPKQELSKSDAGSLARGKQLLQRAQQAMGGAEKLAAVKDATYIGGTGSGACRGRIQGKAGEPVHGARPAPAGAGAAVRKDHRVHRRQVRMAVDAARRAGDAGRGAETGAGRAIPGAFRADAFRSRRFPYRERHRRKYRRDLDRQRRPQGADRVRSRHRFAGAGDVHRTRLRTALRRRPPIFFRTGAKWPASSCRSRRSNRRTA